jgi:hypothetical protein
MVLEGHLDVRSVTFTEKIHDHPKSSYLARPIITQREDKGANDVQPTYNYQN